MSSRACRAKSRPCCRSMYYVDLLRVVSCLAVPKHASLLFTSQTPAAATGKLCNQMLLCQPCCAC